MKFIETKLKGAFVIEAEPRVDQRGFFARTYCLNEFKKHGLTEPVNQYNKSYSAQKGTIRGLHYQCKPHQESKLAQVFSGSIFDVIIDVREDSPTYCHWFGIELTAQNNKMLYCPKGFAHGFQTLEDQTLVFYHSSAAYNPESEKGIRFDDPKFHIQWPIDVTSVSDKDQNCGDFQ
ncbi:MAG: dTDP-4-dehydrorhamnose 3,5-epimerase [Candidatus Omnitrophica bacterium]|nr:dTDP-4-dehydrorhamnose 3,5-epimerase [Candidatus Omnitrophota bacterium]